MKNKFITIKTGTNRYRKVFLDDIILCKAERAYSSIKTDDSEYVFCEPLKKLEKIFEMHESFLRVHKSYIVNIEKCIELKIGAKPELILENQDIIHPNPEILNEIIALFKINN